MKNEKNAHAADLRNFLMLLLIPVVMVLGVLMSNGDLLRYENIHNDILERLSSFKAMINPNSNDAKLKKIKNDERYDAVCRTEINRQFEFARQAKYGSFSQSKIMVNYVNTFGVNGYGSKIARTYRVDGYEIGRFPGSGRNDFLGSVNCILDKSGNFVELERIL
jgi:hypothetical protein